MGHFTYYTGRLDFTRPLNRAELDWIDTIICAGSGFRAASKEIEAILDKEREEARQPDKALFFDMPAETARRAELQGFIAPKGNPGCIEYVLTDDMRGLKYCDGEKSYRMIEGLNFIIANARRKIPDFGLTGSMHASTEFAPYNWHIKIGKDGWAKQVPVRDDFTRRMANRVRSAFRLG
jgi:hypothetical protein